ncbi:NIPSNAP family protein [Flectobacillus major]|uniref:NIPSNAP family protein n=1 Tax=Flectobacillus major TaxID=103 RepID=UPI000414E099|nr:NIPSNAP family protein [Flectobacillus major]
MQKAKTFWSILLFCLIALFQANADTPQDRVYEMRIYYASEGKFEDLMARFRNHTLKYFAKHNMKVEGFWLPLENKENKMIYVLSYPSREAREASWKSFMADTGWQKVMKESAVNGEIVAKIENLFLKMTDFSPYNMKSVGNRIFELRVYKATPNNLQALLDRFRDNTVKLLEKHGMTNIIYWTPIDKAQGADDMLYYILAHKDKETSLDGFKAFGVDPEWLSAKKATEAKAGGSLTVSITSEYWVPADFSPIK